VGIQDRRGGEAEEAVLRLVQQHAVELVRFARRFSWCADDAQDAYQRALEILVRRMRTDPPDHPLSWLRTVIRNEAGTVREQRADMVGRDEPDLDRRIGDAVPDPAERVAGFERLAHTAEALGRLKPQEVTALILRAEGLTYKQIAARTGWTYTRVNRSITEGRRALIARLAAIESGAECERWLPLLSALADGEASSRELAELRPHLRGCPACRATVRQFHDAPHQLAAVVPVVLVTGVAGDPAQLLRHGEALVHWLLERATLTVARAQGAVETLSGTKLAAVTASAAAIAGGGAAIEHAAGGAGAQGAGAPDRTVASSSGAAQARGSGGRGSSLGAGGTGAAAGASTSWAALVPAAFPAHASVVGTGTHGAGTRSAAVFGVTGAGVAPLGEFALEDGPWSPTTAVPSGGALAATAETRVEEAADARRSAAARAAGTSPAHRSSRRHTPPRPSEFVGGSGSASTRPAAAIPARSGTSSPPPGGSASAPQPEPSAPADAAPPAAEFAGP
jgi:RNA polymerase sigma factor (sigma-70 family)